MTDRQFRLGLGALLLACLYYDQLIIVACLIGYLVLEGLTNWRLPIVIARISNRVSQPGADTSVAVTTGNFFVFDAERALRLVIASMLIMSLYLVSGGLWWLAWFVGFALLVSGMSGVCPMLAALRVAGFK